MDKDNNLLYDQTKKLTTIKKEMSISIPFNKLKEGEYKILIDATDLFTSKNTKLLSPVKLR